MTENKINFNDKKSSLQNIDFSDYTKEKVIEKYEEILLQREKQITELSYELGILNEKVSKVKCNILKKRVIKECHKWKQKIKT